MASAGTVEISFAAETAKFTSEVKKVRSQLTDLQKQTAVISRGFSAAGRAITGAFAGLTVATAIRAVVQATSEAEAASAKLTSALTSSSAAASLSVDQLKDYSSELQRTTTFTDEAVQEVEALLLSFRGLSGDTVLKATSAVLDLSTRMGVDLQSAAKMVGKALADPVKGMTALSKAGVQFSSDQQQTIKRLVETGNAAKAQGLILQELEARFGGAAEAARNTFGGAIAGVSNAFGDLLEARGGMPAATSALNRLAETLNSPEIKTGFDTLITGMSRLIELSARAASALPSVSNWIAEFAVSANNIKVFEDAGARLRAELAFEQKQLESMQGFFSLATKQQISDQKAYIETLKERVKLADQIARDQRTPISPVAVSVQRVAIAPTAIGPGDPEFQKQLEDRQKLVSASIATMANELDAFDRRQTEIENRINAFTESRVRNNEELIKTRVDSYIEQTKREVDATLEAEQLKFDAVARFEKQKAAIQQSSVNAAVGLLQALSVRSKTAAKALILVNRGLQIAQTVQNTAAAVMNAMANVPYPYNLAAAAQVKAMGAIQIGLIAATGAVELGSVSSGGGGGGIGGSTLGTPSNPLPVTSEAAGAQQGKVITIQLNGPIAGPEASQWLVDAISDLINDNDSIIINGNSRQAAEIRGG